MEPLRQKWIRTYLSELQMEVLQALYSKVSEDWGHSNVAPPFNCLYFIQGGEGWIKIKGKEYFPRPGQLFILPAGIVHSYSTSTSNPLRFFWCHFNAKVGDLHIFHLLDIPHSIEIQHKDHLEQLFLNLNSAFHDQDILLQLRAKVIMFEIILYILEQLGSDQLRLSSSPSLQKLNELLKYIEDHLAEDLTLERLANTLNYNPKYFIRFFKSLLNMSPIQYINKVRVDKAKRLLITSDLSISQVAEEVGMERIYFSKVFKQYANLTPGQFKTMGKMNQG